MSAVTFTLQVGLSKTARRHALEQVSKLAGVLRAAPINPTATHPAIQRLAYADLDENADANAIAEAINDLPEIESAAVPAARKLV
jgi:hypothetical protein